MEKYIKKEDDKTIVLNTSELSKDFSAEVKKTYASKQLGSENESVLLYIENYSDDTVSLTLNSDGGISADNEEAMKYLAKTSKIFKKLKQTSGVTIYESSGMIFLEHKDKKIRVDKKLEKYVESMNKLNKLYEKVMREGFRPGDKVKVIKGSSKGDIGIIKSELDNGYYAVSFDDGLDEIAGTNLKRESVHKIIKNDKLK